MTASFKSVMAKYKPNNDTLLVVPKIDDLRALIADGIFSWQHDADPFNGNASYDEIAEGERMYYLIFLVDSVPTEVQIGSKTGRYCLL